MPNYKLNCVCVACGTQCEICLEPYPSACVCPSDEEQWEDEEEVTD
jgi:hypothetical protein